MNSTEKLLSTLTEDARVKQVAVGAFCTAVVLDTDPPRCGLASSFFSNSHHDHEQTPVPRAGNLLEASAKELASSLRSSNWLEASIGMAAVNALLNVDETVCKDVNARDLMVERGSGQRVAIVGHFPFVNQIRRRARECWVLELDPCPDDEPAERAGEILPQADVVALSGTTLINHTFESLMDLCRPEAYVLVLGPSAPLTPLLFDYGVDAVSGTRITGVEEAVRAVTQGATFRQIPGRRLLTLIK